ncbi:nitrogen regulation protein NR(II) [Castellaniella sp.]|uniref:nitrogen regulation protein NR(II) n=1 Tax=Castellaniella sp. TaxID=1955812 RepID=UPI003A8F114D
MDTPGLDWLQTAVLLLDESGKIIWINSACEDLLGLSARQLMGQLAAPILKSFPHVLKTSAPGQPWASIIEIPVHQAGQLDDQQQALAERAAQRETMRNLAHEIRNPLAGLRAAAQLLDIELPDPGLKDYTRVIIQEADRLADLVTRLVSPQHQVLERQYFNIHEICERALALAGLEFGSALKITRDYDASLPELLGDRNQLMQAILNIVRNGAQAASESPDTPTPTIGIRTRIVRQPVLLQGRHRLGVLVSIEDNGPGVPDMLRDKIFHPLVTGRATGTGLGLNLAQECAHAHGGVLDYDSEAGHTVFRLLLPVGAS